MIRRQAQRRSERRTPRYTTGHGPGSAKRLARFVMVVEFTEDGPRAQAILTYSESGDPDAATFTDQTKLFSNEQWRDVLFSDEAIEGDTGLETIDISAPR
jgi:hypothetical protein